jgi:hypothetical protein
MVHRVVCCSVLTTWRAVRVQFPPRAPDISISSPIGGLVEPHVETNWWLLFFLIQAETIWAIAMKPTVAYADRVSTARAEFGLVVCLHDGKLIASHTVGAARREVTRQSHCGGAHALSSLVALRLLRKRAEHWREHTYYAETTLEDRSTPVPRG